MTKKTNVFWLAIVTANELGLAFPPSNLPKKFRPDPSTFYSVIVVTNRQTDRQTNAGDSIIPRESFRGDNNKPRPHLTQTENFATFGHVARAKRQTHGHTDTLIAL